MIDDPYRCFVAGIQAVRRRVEALGPAIGGALGVAAEPYPHQVASVRRILTDTRIRHLVSDEVGLGKTVQTLMILNALRYENPGHRAVILVPDRLVRQWYDECWSRAHTHAAVFEEPSELEEQSVRIVRPQSVQSGEFQLDPDQFDMLIIDEPQVMPVDVLDQVERVAGRFRQILILSATPGLADPVKRQRMMTLLEPERTGTAILRGLEPDDVFLRLEQDALARLAIHPEEGPLQFRTFSRERRVIRATRAAWSRYLPRRRYERVDTDPLEAETDRIRLGLDWLEMRKERQDGADQWRAAQALHRGTASARGLVKSRADDKGKLAAALAASAATPGNSRLDALLDIMAGIWREAPAEQILVVAGDNPTIDFLSPRIARNFRSEDEDLEVATLRRLSEAMENEAGDIADMHQQLSDFSSGWTKVLLIGEWIQAGLNLHYFARNIIFYSSPWDTDAVDQLVGRLDRLRPNGLYKGDSGQHLGNIRVWTIVQPDTPEERVVRGLEAVGVYERPLPPLSPDDGQKIRESLERLASGNDPMATGRLADMAAQWDAVTGASLLREFSPYTPGAAQSEYDELQAAELPQPVLLQSEVPSFSAKSERALEGWVRFMSRAGFFQIVGRRDREDEQISFSTIWYPEGGEKNATIRLSDIPRGNWMSAHVPFILRRRFMSRPPRNIVHTDDGEPAGRPLRFLDHGDAVHEELVDGFISHARKVCAIAGGAGRTVMFDERHPAIASLKGKTLLATAGWLDPAQQGLPEPSLADLELRLELATTSAQRNAAKADLDLVMEWWRADRRWLRAELPAATIVSVLQLEGSNWQVVPDELAWSILDPMVEPKEVFCARSRGNAITVPGSLISAGRAQAAHQLAARVRSSVMTGYDRLAFRLDQRLRQVIVEMDELVTHREAEAARRRDEPAPQQEQAQQLWRGRIAAAERRIEMASSAREARKNWLMGVSDNLKTAAPFTCGEILFRPVKADLE